MSDIAFNYLISIVGPNIRLFPYGSYKLGTSTDNSDVDVLCACLDVFEEPLKMVRSLLEHKDHIVVLDEVPTFIPLLKIKVMDIPFDLTFVKINKECTRKTLYESIDRSADNGASVAAINGVYTTDFILHAVKPRLDTFQNVLKRIKQWAKDRYIYGNMLGFPGGVSWTLMLVKIFEIFSTNDEDMLLKRFFRFYSYWRWPDPIILKNTQYTEEKNWNPIRYPQDRCFMAVITPVSPTINSTQSVNNATFKIVQREIRNACMYGFLGKLDYHKQYQKVISFGKENPKFKIDLKNYADKVLKTPGVVCAHPIEDNGEYYMGISSKGRIVIGDAFNET
jgi:poly(A) polymerase